MGSPRDVVCVLGCRAGSKALARRAKVGAQTFLASGAQDGLIVACGGRAWDGVVEADAMARIMIEEGVPEASILRERCSLDTRDNARFAASLLARRGLSRVRVVTCAWHLPRAERLFRSAGLEVERSVGIDPPDATLLQRAYWQGRELVSSINELRRGEVMSK